MWRRRCLSRLKHYFWSSSVRKLLTIALLSAVCILLLWCYISEVLVFKLCSVMWSWPRPYPEKREETRSVSTDPLPLPTRIYHKHIHTHHYLVDAYKTLVKGKRRFRRKDTQLNHYMKILILSDPHIMCTDNKEEWWLARWDADRYLRSSFSYFYPALQPDLVIFLGDVFSNGFEASQRQWDDYVQCLKENYPIFSSHTETEKIIVAMGDNDLGGEGQDYMTESAYRRYEETFGDFNILFEITDQITIVKLTTTCFIRPPSTNAESECRENLLKFLEDFPPQMPAHSSTQLVILITHVPLNQLQPSVQYRHGNRLVDIKTKILLTLRPGLVLSGHDHHESYTQHSLDDGLWSTNEITVPTCSYRMGEMSMGVGSAVISQGGNVAYKVNWLPSRYPFLIGYVLIGFGLLFVCLCLTVCGHR